MRFCKLALLAASCWAACVSAYPAGGASADTLHATYGLSLIGIPIGTADITAEVTPKGYSVDARARLTGLASLISNGRGASTGAGAIVGGHIEPASFAAIASNAAMTRTIRMALVGNAVTGVDITPPIEPKAGAVPVTDKDKQNVVDPVGAFIMPAPAGAGPTSPAACNRTLPIFDGLSRYDLDLAYVGERKVKTKGYSGPVAICSVRYHPIAGHRPDKPSVKFMVENKDIEVWLAPVGSASVLIPYRISIRTQIGTAIAEATEFRADGK